jgi:hypothetical protein
MTCLMPNTWSATTIHFLTQPELRAFFRVITRKRARATSCRARGISYAPLAVLPLAVLPSRR